jgi:hypothetical protein
MTMSAAPIKYTPSVEMIPEDEAQTFEQLVKTLLEISEITFADSRHAFRSVHAKSHGLIEGEMEILPGLALELAQGLFSKVKVFSWALPRSWPSLEAAISVMSLVAASFTKSAVVGLMPAWSLRRSSR